MAKRECEVSERMLLHPHPCIVRLFEVHFFQDNSMYCLVMEFCPDGDMQDAMEKSRWDYPKPRLVHSWIAQVFLGLEHMHLKVQTLNRDVKPANVVLTHQNTLAKLTDFGFSKIATEGRGHWTFGIPTGSPGYCAPEILLQQGYDARADLFSFGVLMWVALTGGLKCEETVQPPISRFDLRSGDFSALAEDCRKLKKCIDQPERHISNPLEEPAKSLVLQLIHPLRDDRPQHAAIRQHDYMRSVELPDAGASAADIFAWASPEPGALMVK